MDVSRSTHSHTRSMLEKVKVLLLVWLELFSIDSILLFLFGGENVLLLFFNNASLRDMTKGIISVLLPSMLKSEL